MIPLLVIALLGAPAISLEKKITYLNSEVKHTKWIAQTIRIWAHKAGFTTAKERNLILAMAMGESSFIHPREKGAAGEEGILQIIPTEKHIRMAARRYRCHRSEIGKSYKVKYKKKGKDIYMWYKPCRCPLRKGLKCNLPNVGYFTNRGYRVLGWKTRLFARYSKRGAFAIGMFEMKFWKQRYETKLKRWFWTKFPWWHYKKRGVTKDKYSLYHTWWKETKASLGDYKWIVHYNYGSRLSKSRLARWYPRKISKYWHKLEKLDGRLK